MADSTDGQTTARGRVKTGLRSSSERTVTRLAAQDLASYLGHSCLPGVLLLFKVPDHVA